MSSRPEQRSRQPARRVLLALLAASTLPAAGSAQAQTVAPAVHRHIEAGEEGAWTLEYLGEVFEERSPPRLFRLADVEAVATGTNTGLRFTFGDGMLSGRLYFGLIDYEDSRHATPVWFRTSAPIENGRAHVDIIGQLSGRYDMTGWAASGRGVLGYRVVTNAGLMVYQGRVEFRGSGPFTIGVTVLEGPTVNAVGEDEATVWLRTDEAVVATLEVDGRSFSDPSPTRRHEIRLTGLSPLTEYDYTVRVGDLTRRYAFRTSPAAGSRTRFSFAYASDSRAGSGGGERNMHGTNFYVMRRIMALATMRNVAFMQFTGDLVNGYLTDRREMDLQYVNWKRAVEPFWHYFPVYTAMGNHEALTRNFGNDRGQIRVARFPYATESAERAFADHFVNPRNGPESEDGASYDPDAGAVDFPPYEENVYYTVYDNAAMVVLNSDYWYSPSTSAIPTVGGGAHGYVMDRQLEWFTAAMATLEADPSIDHVFVTLHTPFFPNGGHVSDDMWYGGNNEIRPWVAGRSLEKGILERRDELLDVVVNRSAKALAILTGDEHNFNVLTLDPDTPTYPDEWTGPTISRRRTIFQVNNGAAGAPYYAQEQTPWTPWVSGFTTQNALVFFHVDGGSVEMEVVNPITLEEIQRMTLR